MKSLNERQKMALNKYTLTSYYLHPTYDNNLLMDEHISMINNFLLKHLDCDGLESLNEYKNKTNFFRMLHDKKIEKADVFWGTASMKHQQLSTLALKLLNIPASTAQLERTFSNWGWIHSSIRNRLTFERSKKLIHVYVSLNLCNTNNN